VSRAEEAVGDANVRTDIPTNSGRERFRRTTRGDAMRASGVQTLILLSMFLGSPEGDAYGQNPRGEAERITVITVQSKDATLAQRYPCRIESLRHIAVRAPSDGYLQEISVRAGQAVKQGDVMFRFVPALQQARLDHERAEVQIAQLEFNHTRSLFEKRTVSEIEVQLLGAKLAKAQAKAKLAMIELESTNVRAPFDGIIDRLPRQVGSFVLKGETLTHLFDNSLVRAYFNVPEKRYLESMAGQGPREFYEQFELVTADGRKFEHPGKLGAVEARFDEKTGTIPFRADFPNPDGLLRHGQSGTLITRGTLKDAILIPQRATFEKNSKRWVYVVDKENIAHQREIVIQNEMEDAFVITKGVGAGDRIVDEGIRLVRDGGKVEE
jgi:membrane fusion protein, multidrug efflux system